MATTLIGELLFAPSSRASPAGSATLWRNGEKIHWPSSSSTASAPAGEEKPLHTKERESLLKLVIGMAAAYHGYDRTVDRSEIPGEIVSELNRVGLSIDVGTVRKFLKQGLQLLPKATGEEEH